jgi:hypothetical protein
LFRRGVRLRHVLAHAKITLRTAAEVRAPQNAGVSPVDR